jgi:hypothetical protein
MESVRSEGDRKREEFQTHILPKPDCLRIGLRSSHASDGGGNVRRQSDQYAGFGECIGIYEA